MTEYFNILNEFMGSGEPKGGIWFIGLEEAYPWDSNKEIDQEELKKYKCKYSCVEKGYIKKNAGKGFTKVFDIMSKIIVGLREKECWKTYRDNQLMQKDSNIFQTNLYPLGKKKITTWPIKYKKWFGFDNSEKDKYIDVIKKTRFPMIKKLWEECAPQLTICFGKVGWQDFEYLFELEKNNCENHEPFKLFLEKKIVFTPFFSVRPFCMPDKKIEELVDLIKTKLRLHL